MSALPQSAGVIHGYQSDSSSKRPVPSIADIDIIKRVVGVPGDTIAVRADVLYRNGEPVPRARLGPSEPGPDVSCWRESLGDASYVVLEHDLEIPDDIDPIVLRRRHGAARGGAPRRHGGERSRPRARRPARWRRWLSTGG